jgi:hypothetical protein
MFGEEKPSIFDKMLPELKHDISDIEDLDTKLERIKGKAAERERRIKKGNTTWDPKLEGRVLIKSQNQSDAARCAIDKFMHVHQGPCIINKVLPH